MDSGTSGSVLSENTVASDSRTYTPTGHKSSGHGIVFHEQYLLLTAYRSLALGNKFSITCEFEEAGKFDDLVYFHEVNGVAVCEMIQYKHVASTKEVLNLSHLVSTSKCDKPYSLIEYFNSYLALYYPDKVTKPKPSDFAPFEQKYRHRINSCVLLTNRGLDVDFVRANLVDCTAETSLFCSGKSYRFKANGWDRTTIRKMLEKSATRRFGLDSNVVRPKIDEFLNKFVLSVENEGKIDLIEAKIKTLIETCLKKRDETTIDNRSRVDVIYKCLCYRMFHFHSDSKVLVAKDTDFREWLLNISEKMSEHMVPVHHEYNMKRLAKFGTNSFTDGPVKKLKDSLENRPENIFCVVGRHCTVFALLKLVQVLKETDKIFHVIVDDQFLSLSDEQVTFEEYLIVSCESQQNWNNVVEKTRRVLGNNTGKKFALVICFEDRSGLERICDETRWSDLTENTRQSLGHKSISFQGLNVPFSVLDVSGVEERIDECVLDGIFHESLNISRRFYDEKSEERDYFIDRRIGRRNRIDLESFSGTDHMFVVENMTEREYEAFVAEQRFDRKRLQLLGERGFDVFCEENRNKNISLLYHVGGAFYWKKSRGESVEESTDEGFDAVIELDDVSRVTDRTVLIVAEPGMGKSNLLSALLERSVDARPDVWIVKIELSSHTERFDEMQKEQKSAIDFVAESQRFETSFESSLFRSYFNQDEKLIVLLDGFDEIAPDYREIVLGLIERLNSISKIRVWLTSRPQEKDYLETRLGLLSYSMLEFTDEDQKQFFTRFWIRSCDIVDDRARDFIDRLLCIARRSFQNTERLLTGIPLQCMMLGEVYRSTFEEFFQKRRPENVDPELPNVIDILNLYGEFVRKIFERHIKKSKLESTQPWQRGLIKKEEKHLNESHKLLSLEIVFPRLVGTTYAAKLKEYKESIIEGQERTGIVHSLDRNRRPVFLHRTFAEYFSALWFYDELTASERETRRDLFDYLEENMFKLEYEVFRKFFDRLSVRSEPVLRHVLNADLVGLEREFSEDPDLKIDLRVDSFRRNALHLAASYGYDGTIEFLIRRGVRTDSRDRLFDWTPLKYGIGGGRILFPFEDNCFMDGLNYDSIESLLPGNEDDRTMFEQIVNRNQVMLNVSQYGRVKFVDYLLKHGMDVDVRERDGCSTLHLAAENGHDNVCATLIEYGSQIDCLNEEGCTPLHYACKERHTSTVALLLDHHADVNVRNDKNVTPLYYAYDNGHKSIVALLLEHGADGNADVLANMTPLHYACAEGDESLVALELEQGVDVNAKGFENRTPLHYACVKDKESIITLLLEHGVDANMTDIKNRTPLYWACERGNEPIVALLLGHGADTNMIDSNKLTPLHLACVENNESIVSLLLEHGVDANMADSINRTALHWACERGKEPIVALLLGHGADAKVTDSKKRTPLHWACKRDNEPIVALLLGYGANAKVTDSKKKTPLHWACKRGNEPIVALLLEHGADANTIDSDKLTPLHLACKRGNESTVALLLEHGVDAKATDFKKRTPLHWACVENNESIVALLLEHGVDVNMMDSINRTALHWACEGGNEPIVALLLGHGADAKVTDSKKRTPLHWACVENNESIVALLLEHGVDGKATDFKKRTPLHLACVENNESIVALLFEHGVDANMTDYKNMTPLHLACKRGNESTVALLLEHGADANTIDSDKLTPLHWACVENNESTVALLLEHGADANMIDSDKLTPLHLACVENNESIVALLLEHGVDGKATDFKKRTPLHWACLENYKSIVALLLEHGVDANMTDFKNMTPLHLACKRGNESPVALLLEHGADANTIDSDKLTPLHWACVENNESIVALLLEYGVDTNAIDSKNKTPLHYAFEYGRVDIVDAYVAHDADVLTSVTFAETLLHSAALSGRVELVEMLLEHGADAKATDSKKRSPLHYAASAEDNESIVALLLEHGADANTIDSDKLTPLHWACLKNNELIVALLLQYDVDINAIDSDKLTPLHLACLESNESIVALLLQYDVDTNAIDSNNKTPLHYAFEYGHVDIVDAYVAHDANVLTSVTFAETLLHSAAASGRVELVEMLLEQAADVNARDHRNRTPLDVALKKYSNEYDEDYDTDYDADYDEEYDKEYDENIIDLLLVNGAIVS